MEKRGLRSKIRVIYYFIIVFAIAISVFCIRWQVIDAAKFTTIAGSRYKNYEIPASRGTLYAKDGSTLAYSEPRFDVYIYIPELEFAENKLLQTRDEFTDKVAPIIDETGESLRNKIANYKDEGILWVKIAESLDLEDRNALQALQRDSDGGELFGTFYESTYERVYPEGKLAAQVLGLTTVQNDGSTLGLGGLEGEWNGHLEPLAGFISGELDAKGNAIGTATVKTIEAKRGSSIYTSIDKKLQQIAQDKLKWGVETYGAAGGSIVIMDPKTGEVMAMANFPDYDPNLREAQDPNVYGNKAVSEPYEVGSVGKVMTLAAGIDTGIITPDTVLLENGHPGCIEITDELSAICTADKLPQPAMPIKDAFAKSDNLYFYALSKLMYDTDPSIFHSYLIKFGIGRSSGVDVSGESYGYLKDWEDWNIADIAAYSYGHSYQVNALQITSAVATLANYGVRMQPHFVTKVVEQDGSTKLYEPEALEKVVSKETVALMDEMMYTVYKKSIYYWEHQYDDLRNYKIAMKSGTALIPNRDKAGYSSDFNATYVGYDASPDRSFIMLVRLDKPTVGDLSMYSSRIVWLETFNAFKDYLGVRRIGSY